MTSGGDLRPTLVPIGGFLGAGKTSLIVAAARALSARGVKAAALLNDQGSELVDTRFVEASGVEAAQVAGGCFCCRLSDLVRAADGLRAHGPEVIFAEAVGSCTDISATVLQPLKLEHSGRFHLAPYTVLVDPAAVRKWMAPDLDSELAYLFYKQVEEADIVCFSKAELYSEFPALPGVAARRISAAAGHGVEAWLDEALSGRLRAGGRILEIDYKRYAGAEASLAWLNCNVTVTAEVPLSPAALAGGLLAGLGAALSGAGLTIAHLKALDETPTGWLKASVVGDGGAPRFQGNPDALAAVDHALLLNARAAGPPAVLERLARMQLDLIQGRVEIHSMECFSPAPPLPERRLGFVV